MEKKYKIDSSGNLSVCPQQKCNAQGAGIKASTAMFLSSDLKGLPSAHYSPWLMTRVPISTAKCNDGFSDVDASLLETGTMKLISNGPLKSHQMVTSFSHTDLDWHCTDNAEIKDSTSHYQSQSNLASSSLYF